MPRCTSWDYKHLWLCLNHLVVCESDSVILIAIWSVCVVWQGVCTGMVQRATGMCSVEPQMGASSSLTSHQFSCKARLDWHVSQLMPGQGWSHYLKDSLHTSCVCHWFSLTFRMIKLFTLLFEEALEPLDHWTIWSWFKWGSLLTESQQLHSCFCRKAGVSSTECALALDLSLGCKAANAGDLKDPDFDSWDTEPSSVNNLHSREIQR